MRVSPQGVKSFIVQYRTPSGRHRRTVIGRFGLMTVEQARIDAHERLLAVSKGIDPAEATASNRRTITIGEICDWYLREAGDGRILGRRNRPIKASTLAMDRSRLETHIRPLIGAKQMRSLRLGDIEGMQADIARGKTAKARVGSRGGATTGGDGVAARTVSTLHAILEHAVRLGLIDVNPARGVRRLAGKPSERRLSTGEIASLGKAMRELAAEGEHATGLAAIRLLLLTGFRRLECLGLQRTWFDAEARCIRFPDTQSGPQLRVIGQVACDLIQSRAPRRGRPMFSRRTGATGISLASSASWTVSAPAPNSTASRRMCCGTASPASPATSASPSSQLRPSWVMPHEGSPSATCISTRRCASPPIGLLVKLESCSTAGRQSFPTWLLSAPGHQTLNWPVDGRAKPQGSC